MVLGLVSCDLTEEFAGLLDVHREESRVELAPDGPVEVALKDAQFPPNRPKVVAIEERAHLVDAAVEQEHFQTRGRTDFILAVFMPLQNRQFFFETLLNSPCQSCRLLGMGGSYQLVFMELGQRSQVRGERLFERY